MTLTAPAAPAPTPEAPPVRRWTTFLAGLGLGALVAATVALWPSGQQFGTEWEAETMADAIGCSDTFVVYEVDEGEGTAGHCEVLGARVLLRTFTDPESSSAWFEGVESADRGMSVSIGGSGYAVFSTTHDPDIMAVIGPALTPGPN